jgi:hypothetical protein
MNQNQTNSGAFPPSSINEVTPHPSSDALSITGLIKNDGKISGYQLSDGENVSKEQGVQMTKENKIKGVAVAVKQGTEYLRSLPDGDENNNLGNLPSVSNK